MPVNFSQSTRADGYVVDEDDWADLVDTINFLGNKPSVRVESNANQAIGSGAATAVTFDTEIQDTDSMWSSTADTRININTAGKYLVGGAVKWASSTVGSFRRIGVRLNGGSTFLTRPLLPPAETGSIGPRYETVTFTKTLTSTNYLELVVDHDTGSNLNIEASTAEKFQAFWAIWQST